MVASIDKGFLKMVGLKANGDQEAKFLQFTGNITFNDVKEAWESPLAKPNGGGYLLKDSDCFAGICKQ